MRCVECGKVYHHSAAWGCECGGTRFNTCMTITQGAYTAEWTRDV